MGNGLSSRHFNWGFFYELCCLWLILHTDLHNVLCVNDKWRCDMKLSMSLLAWYLRDHNPDCRIQDDALCIKGLRFVMDDVEEMRPEYLYFGMGLHFFTDEQYADKCLIVNHHSMMLFDSSDYNMLLNGVLSAFDYFNNWEADLLDAGGRNAPLQEFVDIAAPVFENPLAVGSLDMGFIVSSDLSGHRVDPLWENICMGTADVNPALYEPYLDAVGNKIEDLSEIPQLVRNVYEGGDPVVMLYLPRDEGVAGYISVLQENGRLTEQNLQLAPIFARYCLKAEELVSESGALQSGAALLQRLLNGDDIGLDNLERFAKVLPAPPWRLLAMRVSGRGDQLALNALLSNLKSRPQYHFPLQHENTCLCLAAEGESLQIELLQGSVSVGASTPFSNLVTLPIRLQQAEFALGEAHDSRGVFFCEDFACEYLLRTFRELDVTAPLLHPALEALERYDEENQTELRTTLSAYLYHERNQLEAAKALHVHPNTMRYRLGRIREVAGLTLEDYEELKYLRLSDWLG